MQLKQNVKFRTWFKASNNLHYKLFLDNVNYATAKENCQKYSANLASVGIRAAAIRSELKHSLVAGNTPIWIGLDDIKNEGDFIWADGVPSTIENTAWFEGEPNNSGDGEDCVHLAVRTENLWQLNDESCNLLIAYMCEIKL
ncbi:C-type lectin mannose-binding isoform-like [Styela clava]